MREPVEPRWGKILSRKGAQSRILLANTTERRIQHRQIFINVQIRPGETMTPISSPWPFAQWGIDIMGPFPLGKKKLRFLIVAIDNFTKWVEAKPVTMITEAKFTSFM